MAERPEILLALTGLSLDGGISSVSRSIVRILDAEVEKGHCAAVHRVLLLDQPGDVPEPAKGMRQHCASGSRLRFIAQLWFEMLRARPAIVLFDHVGLGRSLFPQFGLPHPDSAIFVHGLELRGAENDIRGKVLEDARWILSNSDFTNASLSAAIPAIADRIQTVPLCVEPERIEEWQGRRGDAGSSGPRCPAVLIVGRMWKEQPGKGHEALIEGWSNVLQEIPDAELWIVGTGDQVESLEQLAEESGAGAAVQFLGRVSDERLSELYSKASAFAMPSSQEGFGLVYLEAMWHELPCIVSRSDAGQYVVDEATGLSVEYGNAEETAQAVVALLSDAEKARTMGAAARRRVDSEFSFESFSRNLKLALSDVLNVEA
ncbi:MAG: glycosyltransferase family 4 protein [Myxococcota bacterium]